MKILIVENEIYLAQNISRKLMSLGHDCEILTDLKDILECKNVDTLLLSTNIFGDELYKIIENFKDSVIILLISYISNDTVSKPIQAGADDYIQKPFMIEELVRKIHHFEEFNRIKKLKKSYDEYIEFFFSLIDKENSNFYKINLPFFIKTNSQIFADKFAFDFFKFKNLEFEIILLDKPNSFSKIKSNNFKTPMYLINYQLLKNEEKTYLLTLINKKNIIISTTNLDEEIETKCVTVKSANFLDRILTVDEYFQHILINYQNSFSDTDLAKKLGISRKSLWEKRKKYGISKKK
ncbi:response regulator receiver domain-containing protein [Campylobacter blaseri]|uniref:Response regulatory domain-containing protein n=1 Tax=Campylobacter blaseri TaxID=2042961 RepID=A0A2P8QZ22_9BACT|nr:response regulator [Campylobacter blaseri]PSM51489.1 hypothetical protein CQ405_07945 [Campylobacter blaseri]PSM52938.1 hypothetical protein CRN67_07950 [Campylobacter blaseri]QKF86503.1 response regulator receiver domain-containing protein [Campylobacter blaseri]